MFRKDVVEKEEETQVLAKKVQPFKLSATTFHVAITLENGAEEEKNAQSHGCHACQDPLLHKFRHICQVNS